MNIQKNFKNEIKRVEIIGVPISAVTMNFVINYVQENLNQIRGSYICASNVHTTVMAHENNDYKLIQLNSLISLPDGKPLSTIGKIKGFTQMEKVTGTHFMIKIFKNAKLKNANHYFYGTTDENLRQLESQVRINFPSLKICGIEPSVFRELTEKEIDELCSRINESNTDFLWIGIGAPRQEILMSKMQGKVNCLMIGVGGAFNILSGKVKDAPLWMQNIGLEWLFRFVKEPKRLFKRYLITNTKFLWYLWREKWKN